MGKKPGKQDLAREQLVDAVASCACFNFRRASRAITQMFDEVLLPSGLRSTQLVILLQAAVHGEATISKLASELMMDASTLHRNLQPLADRQLVKVAAGGDGRRRIVQLTKRGREAIDAALPLWEKAQAKVRADMKQHDWASFLNNVSRVARAARSNHPAG